ncbi:hypothetical protein JHK84_056402 [Glycine max]|nr:hypothetical protein JHK86_056362 [Glycine max]KAG4919086.1 hypothetical protein JHK85_057367 [Glycine max]KAG5075171.1 hypothetical protein JHK84_056402 [Glycine max]
MELCMGSYKSLRIIVLLMLLSSAPFVSAFIECSTITQFFSACSISIIYGSPDPIPGSPCCDAMSGLNNIANTGDNRPYVCRCLMGLIDTYSPNATAIATLPAPYNRLISTAWPVVSIASKDTQFPFVASRKTKD